MAELPITFCNLKHTPEGPGSRDGYRWHVGIEEDGAENLLVVDISGSQAVGTGLGTTGLNEAVRHALQVYAAGRLRDGEPVLGQVADWASPIVLVAAHFR